MEQILGFRSSGIASGVEQTSRVTFQRELVLYPVVVSRPRLLPRVAAPLAFAIVTVSGDVSHIATFRAPDIRIVP